MTNAPCIDVLIPAYNAAATIRSAVGSIQAQSIADIRIIVVDDGSTDETPAILADIAASDPRLIVHRQPNGGIVDALNAGLALCGAPFVARHDADDLAYPDRFARQIAYFDAHPDCVALGGAVRHIDADDRPVASVGEIRPIEQADLWAVPCREPYIVHPFLMARRDALLAVGGYRHVCHAEDSDLYWRLQEVGRLHNLTDVLGDYRVHDQSISGASLQNGRIMAVCSQLAGISARHRRAGQPDLRFEKGLLARLKAADGLAAIVGIAEEQLDEDECSGFEELVAAKLLELAGYRPYELTVDDCRFVRRVCNPGFGHLPAGQRAVLERQISGTAARLMHRGARRAAIELLPRRFYPQAIARLGVRAVRHRLSKERAHAG